ncbi:MAG: carboxy terminal-processing peptidase [Flavobacteriales bacterium]|nr:carboxy terminal-processing peptidase [Flavobacteriales bacterium]
MLKLINIRLTKRGLLLGVFSISFMLSFGQINTCEKAKLLVESITENHYNPRPIDQQFSEYTFDYFIDLIDEQKLIFSKEDYILLAEYKLKLSDEILNNNCEFIELVNTLYFRRLGEIKSIIKKIDVTKVEFKSDDNVVFDKQQAFFSEKERINNWTNWIKFQALTNHFSKVDSVDNSTTVSKSTIEQAIEVQSCIMDGIIKDSDFVYESYLNAIAQAFDPHTNYFSVNKKESFETMLSKETKSYGIEIAKNAVEQIEVVKLLPGGPAWRSNLINEGDVLLSVKGNNEKKSFVCISLQEATYFINSTDYSTLTFEISKKNSQNQEVILTKENIDVENNIIQSYVLEGDKKIGYIYLPSFYTAMEMDENSYFLPNGCANDIAKELFKLKREGIDGLIIDVRNNGGGSMLEAVRLSGVFIDYGAVAISDQKNEKPQTIKDMDRGAAFSKPLVIMVNGFSASASELFAAAMQDQNRAVVVGSTTFGKATMQRVMAMSEEDYLKITLGKFFRVNGKSHQNIGVIPDVELPSYYAKLDMRESMYPSVLGNTEITHKTYYYPRKELPIASLKELSKTRVDTNEYFIKVNTIADYLYEQENYVSISLNFNKFKLYYEKRNLQYDEMTDTFKSTSFTVHNPSYLSDIRQETETEIMINKQTIKNIENSIFISESYNVISDLINNQKH